MFQPEVGQNLVIGDQSYSIAEHPAARNMPYGQEGRQAVVYQLVSGNERAALKVFKPFYRVPGLVGLSKRLAPYATLPGLQVCERSVLTPQKNSELLREHPDLTYAVLMPWMDGPTWMEVSLSRQDLTHEQSLMVANSLAHILSTMEQESLAHCDLSGPNVIVPAFASNSTAALTPVVLVDVEQMYGLELKRPELVPLGSSGYAHKSSNDGQWSDDADRFAGAILLAEMLGWCDPRVREAASNEGFFDQEEIQQDCPRYHLLVASLREHWGSDIAWLFERVWKSEILSDCPNFADWLVRLPEPASASGAATTKAAAPFANPLPTDATSEQRPIANDAVMQALLDAGGRSEDTGDLTSALNTFRQAQSLTPPGDALYQELGLIIQRLQNPATTPPTPLLESLPSQSQHSQTTALTTPQITPAVQPPPTVATSQNSQQQYIQPQPNTPQADPYAQYQPSNQPQLSQATYVKTNGVKRNPVWFIVPALLLVVLLAAGFIVLGQLQSHSTATATPTTGISGLGNLPSATPRTEQGTPTAIAGLIPTTAPTSLATIEPTSVSTPPTQATVKATLPPTVPEIAPTVAPTVVAIAPPLGRLVYQDDFNNGPAGSGLEDEGKGKDSSRGFHTPGVYHFKFATPDDARWVVLPHLAYDNFTMQVDLWDNSDNYQGSMSEGVVFHLNDQYHFYTLLIDPRKGQYTVRKADGKGVWTDLIPWKPSALIKSKAEVNHLRVDANGTTFTFYLNETPLDTFTDTSYGPGLLGMITINIDAVLPHTHFDNLKVWTSDTASAPSGLPPTRDNPAGVMALISGGEFIIGSNEKSSEWSQMLNLPDFYIDRTEVTNAAYTKCVAAGKCTPQKDPASETHPSYATQDRFANYPVIHVTWEQANGYCAWAGKRLPTEAEWEKAATWDRTTNTKATWPWNGAFDPAKLNSSEANNGDTTPAAQYPPELNGTVDMGGNVSEWTSSLFKDYPYRADDGRENPDDTGDRVFRGGSWAQSSGKARGYVRQAASPTYADREIGFRCAVTP